MMKQFIPLPEIVGNPEPVDIPIISIVCINCSTNAMMDFRTGACPQDDYEMIHVV